MLQERIILMRVNNLLETRLGLVELLNSGKAKSDTSVKFQIREIDNQLNALQQTAIEYLPSERQNRLSISTNNRREIV